MTVVAVGVSVPWGLWGLPAEEQRRLLGRIADAGIDHVFTADHVSFRDGSGMDGLVTLAALAGRDVEWQHGLQLWLGVGDSPEEGRSHVAVTMERFYRMSFEPFERYTPCGTAEDIAEFLRPYVAAGATTLNLTPCGPDRAAEIEAAAEVKQLLVP